MTDVLIEMIKLRDVEAREYYVTEHRIDVLEFCNKNYNKLVDFYNNVKDTFLEEKGCEEVRKIMSGSTSFKSL